MQSQEKLISKSKANLNESAFNEYSFNQTAQINKPDPSDPSKNDPLFISIKLKKKGPPSEDDSSDPTEIELDMKNNTCKLLYANKQVKKPLPKPVVKPHAPTVNIHISTNDLKNTLESQGILMGDDEPVEKRFTKLISKSIGNLENLNNEQGDFKQRSKELECHSRVSNFDQMNCQYKMKRAKSMLLDKPTVNIHLHNDEEKQCYNLTQTLNQEEDIFLKKYANSHLKASNERLVQPIKHHHGRKMKYNQDQTYHLNNEKYIDQYLAQPEYQVKSTQYYTVQPQQQQQQTNQPQPSIPPAPSQQHQQQYFTEPQYYIPPQSTQHFYQVQPGQQPIEFSVPQAQQFEGQFYQQPEFVQQFFAPKQQTILPPKQQFFQTQAQPQTQHFFALPNQQQEFILPPAQLQDTFQGPKQNFALLSNQSNFQFLPQQLLSGFDNTPTALGPKFNLVPNLASMQQLNFPQLLNL